jgi:flagellar basal-body rod modification protein FlgD
VTSITSTNTDLDIANLQLAATGAKKASKQLGQQDFLALMIQQLRNQDPLKPMENGEFIGQMAQFSTVTGIADMTKSIASLADSFNSGQALQAASMVGRTVLTEASTGSFSGTKPLSGAVELPYSTSSAVVRVYSSAGELVRELPLGTQEKGLTNFSWDGTLANGQPAPAGRQRSKARPATRHSPPISRRRSRASRSRATAAVHKSGPTVAPVCASRRSRQSCKENHDVISNCAQRPQRSLDRPAGHVQ